MHDPLQDFETVIEWARRCRVIDGLLGNVRKIDESSEETIKRLIQERNVLANLFYEARLPHGDFDFQYKDNFVESLHKLLEGARQTTQSQIENKEQK